jgi:hypothetical protein
MILHSMRNFFILIALQIVCPMTIIDYPGSRVFDDFLKYSNTRVIGSSTRVQWMQLNVITLVQLKTEGINQMHYFEVFFGEF